MWRFSAIWAWALLGRILEYIRHFLVNTYVVGNIFLFRIGLFLLHIIGFTVGQFVFIVARFQLLLLSSFSNRSDRIHFMALLILLCLCLNEFRLACLHPKLKIANKQTNKQLSKKVFITMIQNI